MGVCCMSCTHKEKLIVAHTVKLSESEDRFIQAKMKQLGHESPGEYFRYLISIEMEAAEHDFNLLAQALGVTINPENHVTGTGSLELCATAQMEGGK